MSSSPSHATVTYTSMSSDDDVPSWAHALVYSEYRAPAEAQPLPASVSPTVLSPDYSADFEPVEEDPEEDPKEEPSKEEEEELSALADSLPARLYIDLPSEGTNVGPTSDPLSPSIDAFVNSWVAAPAPPLPPPSRLSPLSSPLPRIPFPPLLLPPLTRRDIIPEADMTP
ncbi:hypothetical protein Tco_0171660 [Tanacetum coccineum]